MRVKASSEVHRFVDRQPEGEPFSPTDLLLYGMRASIDQALSRLTKDGVIERVARGVYVKPRRSRIVGKVPPSPVAVTRTYARARGIPVTTPGAQVLADYGLTTQTPVTAVRSAGVSGKKTLRVGNRQVTLRHALRQAGTPAGDALAALHHLDRRHLRPAAGVTPHSARLARRPDHHPRPRGIPHGEGKTLPPQDQLDIPESVVDQENREPVILEKDLWVVWALAQTFALDGGEVPMAFKGGGTSLSKGYAALTRFSENLDITLRLLGASGRTPEDLAVMTRNQRDRALDALGLQAQALVQD